MRAEIGTDIFKAKAILESGGLVAIPTETVYGLASNALNPDAILKIFEAKNRPTFDPLIIHIASFAELNKYATSNHDKLKLLQNKFWPGPLTCILNKNSVIPDIVTSGLSTAGFRVPNHKLANQLLDILDFPLAAPSANPFGYISPTSAQHVYNQLGDKIDYILDGGNCEVGLESTIVKQVNEIVSILRFGGISKEEIENIIGEIRIETSSIDHPSAPGMLESHYSPFKKLFLFNSLDDLEKEDLSQATIIYIKEIHLPTAMNELYASKSMDLREVAKNLFSMLRDADSDNSSKIYFQLVEEKGLGRAINDRLRKAAYQK